MDILLIIRLALSKFFSSDVSKVINIILIPNDTLK
jgi:hypothetical protein